MVYYDEDTDDYECETCGCVYEDEDDAEECEDSHDDEEAM